MTFHLKYSFLTAALALAACSAADDRSNDVGAPAENTATSKDALTIFGTGSWVSDSVKDVAVTTPASGVLDEFLVATDGQGGHWRLQNGNWTFTALGTPSGTTLRAIAGTHSGSGNLDVFAIGANGHVYWKFTHGTNPITWSGWSRLNDIAGFPDVPAVNALSRIAATSWGTGRIDVFWTTPTHRIAHAWFDDWSFSGSESGDQSGKTHFRLTDNAISNGPIEAVSWGHNRIDVVLLGGSGRSLHHHYWTGSQWLKEALRCDTAAVTDGEFIPDQLSIASQASGEFHVFTRVAIGSNDNPPASQRLQVIRYANGAFPQNSPGFARFQTLTVTPSGTTLPSKLYDALHWSSGGGKTELFGGNEGGTFAGDVFQGTFLD